MPTVTSPDGTVLAIERHWDGWTGLVAGAATLGHETACCNDGQVPDGRIEILAGQPHDPAPEALAPVLERFLSD